MMLAVQVRVGRLRLSAPVGSATARESRDRLETIGEASMARESRLKSETMEDAGGAAMNRGQSSGIANCSVSPSRSTLRRGRSRGDVVAQAVLPASARI